MNAGDKMPDRTGRIRRRISSYLPEIRIKGAKGQTAADRDARLTDGARGAGDRIWAGCGHGGSGGYGRRGMSSRGVRDYPVLGAKRRPDMV